MVRSTMANPLAKKPKKNFTEGEIEVVARIEMDENGSVMFVVIATSSAQRDAQKLKLR